MYEDAIAFLRRREDPKERRMNERTRLSSGRIKELETLFPGIPHDYIEYLRQIGSRSFRECQFMVFAAPALAADFIGEEAADCYGAEQSKVLCFGDNFSGDFSGFLPSDKWAVVELWHDDGTLWKTGKSFGQYIRAKMLMGPHGQDLRT